MKKLVTKSIKVLLILLILISALFACEQNVPDENLPNDDSGENQPSGDSGENNTPEEAPDEDQPSEDNTQAAAGIELTDEDSDLVEALVKYLKDQFVQGDATQNSVEEQINRVKSGEVQPLLVEIDPDSFYFICCYSDVDRVDEMLNFYQNSFEYTWVKYEKSNEIKEIYNEKKVIEVFQINSAYLIQDIVSNDAESIRLERFQLFSKEFINGLNVSPAKVVNKAFIYLNETDSDTIYYSERSSVYNTIDCTKIENHYYIELFLYQIDLDGEKSDYGFLEWNLGEYYEQITKLITNEYSVYSGDDSLGLEGCTHYYGLVDVEELADGLLK